MALSEQLSCPRLGKWPMMVAGPKACNGTASFFRRYASVLHWCGLSGSGCFNSLSEPPLPNRGKHEVNHTASHTDSNHRGMSANSFQIRTCLQRQLSCVPFQSMLGEHRLRGSVYMCTRSTTCSSISPMPQGAATLMPQGAARTQSHKWPLCIDQQCPAYAPKDLRVRVGLYSVHALA